MNSSRVQFAAVEADKLCPSETRFILYMAPGEVLSRSFTSKDTHSPKGDLVVMYTDSSEVSEAIAQRSLASASILGFHPPSFAAGNDLILPVEANKQLRKKLLAGRQSQNVEIAVTKEGASDLQTIQTILELIMTENKGYASLYIPEVCQRPYGYGNYLLIARLLSKVTYWNLGVSND